MEWFKSSIAEAQKTAQEAAGKARVLAQQASQQARVLAEQASVHAKVLAERTVEEAVAVQSRLNQMAGPSAGGQGSSSVISPEELDRFGVNQPLLDFISTLTYSMFSDMNSGAPGGGETSLTPWQERHAVLVLGQAPHLQGLRFALSPRHMTDNEFWSIYFKLAHSVLPPERDRDAALAAPADTAAATTTTSVSDKASAALAGTTSMFGSLLRNTQSLLAAGQTQLGTGMGGGSGGGGTAQQSAAPSTPTVPDARQAPASLLATHDAAAADRQGEELSEISSVSGDGAPDLAAGSGDDALSEPLGDMEDDPELEAYLQEALAVDDDDAEGDGAEDELSDLGSAAEDLDDYITQLDAELAADGTSAQSTPQKPKP